MKGIFRPSNFSNKKKSVMRGVFGFIFVLLPVALTFLTPLPADACGSWFTEFGCNLQEWSIRIVTTAIAIVMGIISMALGVVVGVAKSILDLAINMALSVPYTSGPVIDAAWPVVRDIANMGLILVLIAIGVGTMLSLRSVNKRLLVPFFIIAILINFTPLLTGIIIDLSNITARIFYDSASAFSNALFNVGIWQEMSDTVGEVQDAFQGLDGESVVGVAIVVLMNSFLGILFNIILILVYAILAILFFVRMFFLWLLVILSPAAFLAYILPTTRKWFNRWWHNFLQWAIIVIPLLFFLWMAGLFANNAELACTAFIEDEGGATTYGFVFDDASLSGTSIGYEVVCKMTTTAMAVLTVAAGIIISTSSSAEGARGIIKKTRGAYEKRVKDISRKAGRGAYAPIGRTKDAATQRAGQAGRALGKSGLADRHYVGAPFRAVSEGLQKPSEKLRKQQGEADKKYKDKKTFEEMRPHLLGGGDYNDRVAAFKKAAELDSNKLSELMGRDDTTGKRLRKQYESLKKTGALRQDKELKEVDQKLPHLTAESYDQKIEKEEDGDEKEKLQKEKREALEKIAKDSTTSTFRDTAVRAYKNKDVIDAYIKAGKLNQAANAVHGNKEKSDALNQTLGQFAPPVTRSEKSEDEQKKTREKYKRKARAEGADVEVTRDTKGRFKSKWNFTDSQVEEAKKEMEADFKARKEQQEKELRNYILQNTPSSSVSDDTDRPWLAAATKSMGKAERAGEQVISKLNLERNDIEKLSTAIGDKVEEAMESARKNESDITDKQLRKIFHEEGRAVFDQDHQQHLGQPLYGDDAEHIVEYLLEERRQKLKDEGKWPDK